MDERHVVGISKPELRVSALLSAEIANILSDICLFVFSARLTTCGTAGQ